MDPSSNMPDQWIADALRMQPCVVLPDGNIRGCVARLSFPHLYSPVIEEGKEPQWSAAFLIPQMADITLLKQAAGQIAMDKWGNLVGTPGFDMESPFKDQGAKAKHEGYIPGRIYLSCNTTKRPVTIDSRGAVIVDPGALEAGCWVLPLLRPFAWEYRKQAGGPVLRRGVSFGLQGVIKVADDKSLGGGSVDVQSAVGGIALQAGDNPAGLFGGGVPQGQTAYQQPQGQYPQQQGPQGGYAPPQGYPQQGYPPQQQPGYPQQQQQQQQPNYQNAPPAGAPGPDGGNFNPASLF